MSKTLQIGLLTSVTVLLLAFMVLSGVKSVGASAPSGLKARVATTSLSAVSSTAITLFATSTCSARVITTAATPIMLTFSDYANQTPTGVFGHLQAASTTVVYDSGQFGCDRVKAYSFGASTITITEAE